MGYVLLVFGILALGAAVFFTVTTLLSYKKDRRHKALDKQHLQKLGIALGCYFVSAIMLQMSIALLANWDLSTGLWVMAVAGAALFLPSFALLWMAFTLRFSRPDTEPKQLRIIKICLYGSIPFTIGAFLLMGEGFAQYLSYPLVSGFTINDTGFHWVTAATGAGSGFHLAWYGLFILTGFIVSYFVSDHEFYKMYHKHGILENCLFVVFVFGILGARIWYVVGNWNGDAAGGIAFADEVAAGRWYRIFAVWEGGLTVLGGVVAGVVSGALYLRLRRKYVDIRFAMDAVMPTILIAQAIGRWGNFFNNEVYGQTVAMSPWWNFLPTWIKLQMNFDGASRTFLEPGMMNVPLFLIEGIFNLVGFFVIAKVVPLVWKKGRELGVLGSMYLIWYGVVRIIMEPMRNVNYNMGTTGGWSVWNSLAYIIAGVVLVVVFELVPHILRKKKQIEPAAAPEQPAEEKPAEEPPHDAA